MKHLVRATLAMAALALSVSVAEAHPRLLAATPAANSHIAAPAQVRLSFSETLIGRFSKVSILDSAGRQVRMGRSTLSPDHKQLIASVASPLRPGMYRVAWQVVSTDTHHVKGGYAFMVMR